MNVKIFWGAFGVVVIVFLGYLASRVGNIGARSLRDGQAPMVLTISEPVIPGVEVSVRWNTSLGGETGPVVLKAKSEAGEVEVGTGELGSGRATIVIPCEMSGENVGVGLYTTNIVSEQLLTQRLVSVLPAGPDCLR